MHVLMSFVTVIHLSVTRYRNTRIEKKTKQRSHLDTDCTNHPPLNIAAEEAVPVHMVVPGDIQEALEEVVRTQTEERELRMQVVEDRIQDGEKELRTRTVKVRSLTGVQEGHRDTTAGHSLGLEKDRARDQGRDRDRIGLLETDCSILDDRHSRDPGCKVDMEVQKEVEHREEEAQ